MYVVLYYVFCVYITMKIYLGKVYASHQVLHRWRTKLYTLLNTFRSIIVRRCYYAADNNIHQERCVVCKASNFFILRNTRNATILLPREESIILYSGLYDIHTAIQYTTLGWYTLRILLSL